MGLPASTGAGMIRVHAVVGGPCVLIYHFIVIIGIVASRRVVTVLVGVSIGIVAVEATLHAIEVAVSVVIVIVGMIGCTKQQRGGVRKWLK